jgi:hypothetical protein
MEAPNELDLTNVVYFYPYIPKDHGIKDGESMKLFFVLKQRNKMKASALDKQADVVATMNAWVALAVPENAFFCLRAFLKNCWEEKRRI